MNRDHMLGADELLPRRPDDLCRALLGSEALTRVERVLDELLVKRDPTLCAFETHDHTPKEMRDKVMRGGGYDILPSLQDACANLANSSQVVAMSIPIAIRCLPREETPPRVPACVIDLAEKDQLLYWAKALGAK